MRRPLLIGLLWLTTAVYQGALAEHGADESSDDRGTSPSIRQSPAAVLLESSSATGGGGNASGKKGIGGSGQGPKRTGGGAENPDSIPIRISGYPLFLFADGPDRPGGPVNAEITQMTTALTAELKRKIPGAQVLRIAPLSANGLENAWRKARLKDRAVTSRVTSALLIVNARAAVSPTGGLQLLGEEGALAELRWRGAIRKLSQDIFPQGTTAHGSKIETILLTSQAGAISCRNFPGPVFGATKAGQSIEREDVRFWIDWQESHPTELFPVSAREWFDGWRITNQRTHYQYFYCPHQNTRGYLGNKKSTDDFRDGT